MILLNKKINLDNISSPFTKDDVFFLEESKLIELIKYANKQKINKIYLVENDELILKINNRWKTFSKFNFNLSFIKYKKFKLKSKFKFPEVDIVKKDENVNFDLSMNKFIYDDKTIIYQKISFIILNDLTSHLNVFEKCAFSYMNKSVEKEKTNNFFEKLRKNAQMPGLPIKRFSEDGESKNIYSKSGETYIELAESNVCILTMSTNQTFEDGEHYSKNFNINLLNNMLEVTTNPPKLNKKTISISLLSFIIVILLFYVTINHIFGLTEIQSSFNILFDRTTWKNPIIYLLVINFIITFFYSFLLAMLMDFLFNKGRKSDYKRMWEMFLSAQVRTIAILITGNFIFATFIWSFYLNKKAGIRVSSLIGTMGVINILKSIMQIIMTMIFMIPGTIYVSGMFETTSQALILLSLAWGGMMFSIFHNVFIAIVIFIPFIQNIYIKNKIKFQLKINNNISSINKVNSEIFYMTFALKGMFKDKQRITRVFALTFVMTIFEALETVMIFQLVENYRIEYGLYLNELGSKVYYWNFISIAGVRLMSTYVHFFPGLNIIPGQGIGITDLFMSNINELIIMKQHGITSALNIDENVIALYSKQVTFITRFLNFYLRKIISLFIVIIIVVSSTIKYINRKHHNIKNV